MSYLSVTGIGQNLRHRELISVNKRIL